MVLEITDPIVPYAEIPIKSNKKPPIKEPITPIAKLPQIPKPPPCEIMTANPPEINPINKNQSISYHLL